MPLASRICVILAVVSLHLPVAPRVAAQQIRGPVLGFVLEADSGLKPILGIPGAATMGGALAAGLEARSVSVSPDQDFALALAGEDGRVFLIRDLKGSPAAAALPGFSGVSRIEMSPAGQAAALYEAASQTIRVVSGLPQAPVAHWETEPGWMHGRLSALAVSDNASVVLVAVEEGERVTLWALAAGEAPRYLAPVGGAASLAFLTRSGDALVADGIRNEVLWMRDVPGAVQIVPLAGEREGVSRPVGVAATADGQRVIVANSDPGGVLTVDLPDSRIARISCECVPSGLYRLSGKAVFRLNGPSEGPIAVFDGDSAEARVVFVPREGGAQ